MLTAPAFRRRIASRAWAALSARRAYASKKRAGIKGDERRKQEDAKSKSNGNVSSVRNGNSDSQSKDEKRTKPSLIEQLFPERYAAGGTHHRDTAREVPKIPTEEVQPPVAKPQQWLTQPEEKRPSRSDLLRRAMEAQPPDTSVLVLRNAGKNLTEEDFRRVIPQGKHLEGWTLEQGDILRVVPARDLETLEQTGSYFLLFSSPLSAFTYQGHVTRIHRMVAAHSPSSLLSPVAPPPGYMLEGMDAHDAINSFTLTAPDQKLQLRQLKPPLSPLVQHIVKHGGYEPVLQRKDHMPFEARLTLEGPQLALPFIRHVLRTSGRDMGRAWSGDGDNEAPKLSQWQPISPEDMPSPSNKKVSGIGWDADAYKREQAGHGVRASTSGRDKDALDDGPRDDIELKRRTPRPVYIVGFATEQALHSFILFWHGRAMTWEGAGKGAGEEEGDVPPIAHVQALW